MEKISLNKKMLKPLDEILRCRVCTDYFKYCVITPCCHNFCSLCIRKHMVSEEDCPICFEEIQESELRNNKIIDKIVRVYKKLRSMNDGKSDPAPQALNTALLGSVWFKNNNAKEDPIAGSNSIAGSKLQCDIPSIKVEVPDWDDCVGIQNEIRDSTNEGSQGELDPNEEVDISSPDKMDTSVPFEMHMTIPSEMCGSSSNHETLLIIPNKIDDMHTNLVNKKEIYTLTSSTPKQSSNVISLSNSKNSSIRKNYNKTSTTCNHQPSLTKASLPQEWYLTFPMPWDKMPSDLLTVLKTKERPSPKLRRLLVRIICSKVEEFIKKPGNKILSAVARKAFEKYPESLCDNPDDPPSCYSYRALTQQLVTRIENVNRKRSRHRSPLLECDLGNSKDSSYASADVEFLHTENVAEDPSSELDKSSHISETSADADMAGNSISSANSDSNSELITSENSITDHAASNVNFEDVLGARNSSEWYKTFSIPWDEMPSSLIHDLEEKKRPNPLLRRTMVKIICNKIRAFDFRPPKHVINMIAKKAFEKYPDSLRDVQGGLVLQSNCLILASQISNRLVKQENIQEMLSKKCSPNRQSNDSFSSVKSQFSQHECFSTLSTSWYETFEIPWDKMPGKLIHDLKQGQRLDNLSRRTMVRIICEKIRKFNLKPSWKILSVIAKKAFETYPTSLCDDTATHVSKYNYRTLQYQLHNRLMNYFKVKLREINISNTNATFNKSAQNEESSNEKIQFCQPTECSESFNSTDLTNSSGLGELCNNTSQFNRMDECEERCDTSASHQTVVWELNDNIYNCTLQSDSTMKKSDAADSGVQDQASEPLSMFFSSEWDENFDIPWHKMSGDLLHTLNEKKRPDRRMRSEMVRVICDEIRAITKRPGKKSLTSIAKKVFETYPESLCDNFCGEVVGNGYTSLINQLSCKIENQNRSEKIRRPKSCGSNFSVVNHHGCINWLPGELPMHECKESQQQKKEELKLISECFFNALDTRTIKLLDDTFYTQRQDIIKSENIKAIIKEWPLLFTVDGMLNHFKMLLGFDSLQKFHISLLAKANTIFYYFMSISKHASRKTLQLAFQELEHMSDLDKVESPAVIMALVMAYFNEKRENLFLNTNSGTTKNDVEGTLQLPETPCLIICGETLFHGSSFMFSVCGTIVHDKINSFEKGLVMLFTSFFVLNIGYPATVKATLEFTQRCLLGINPNKNIKISNRKAFDKKVVALIKNLADYQH